MLSPSTKVSSASLAGLSTEQQLVAISVLKKVMPLFIEHSEGYYEKFYEIYEQELLQVIRNKALVIHNLKLTDYFDQGSFKLVDLQTAHKIDVKDGTEQFLTDAEYKKFMQLVLKSINLKSQILLLSKPTNNKQKQKVETSSNNELEGESVAKKQEDSDEYLSIEECATFLDCSKVTIHKYKKLGLPFLKIGRTVKFSKKEVVNFMRQQSRKKRKE